jgi:dienelactone hydrolase
MTRLRDLDAAPELREHPGHKFLITVSHRQIVPVEVIDSIAAWLKDVHPATKAAPHSPVPRAGALGPSAERPVRFGERYPLFGILTPTDPAKADADRPAIVIANAGCVNRAGPHAMFTKMARRWAALGFDVLRVDLSGIGDSPARPGVQENVTYPPTGLDDLAEAVRSLGRRAIIVGLCSGGDYAFQLGAHGANVVGAWLLNPRTFCVLDLVAVESGAPPAGSVDDVPKTLRSMAERAIDTLLVVSKNDPGVAYVDAHAGEAMRALAGVAGFRRVDVDGADHPFTPVTVQEHVSDVLTEHLVARHGSGASL